MSHVNKHDAAAILEEIAVLLELQGENPFKVRAYRNAARTIESLGEDLSEVVRKKKLEELPGIGAHIAEKITVLVQKGRLPYFEKLKKSVPPGLLDLLKVPGLGGKKVKTLYEKLKVKSTADLVEACRKGKVAKLAGFGKKTEANILAGIEKQKVYGKRMLWWDAFAKAQPLLEALAKLKAVQRVEAAGSLRRRLETVGDLDIVVASAKPKAVMEWFTSRPWVEKITAKGPSKSSVRLEGGCQADLRVVSKEQFGYALLYFTGSKEHNIRIRQIAISKGYSLSEYGLEGARMKKNADERAIYKALGLSYIPPEMREDTGEIEAAAKDRLPKLIEEKDIRGVFHCHTTASDGHNTLEEMAAAAAKMKWEYLGIADHSKSSVQANGLSEKRLFQQIEQIRALNRSGPVHVFAGLECDILPNGKLDFSDDILKELDYVVASIHGSFKLSEKAMTARLIRAIENPYTTIVGHPTGRLLLRREPYSINLAKVIDACIANGKIMEINAHPMRLDMDWRLLRQARDRGLRFAINPDAHSVDNLQYFRAGINIARKGWLEKSDVINSFPLKEIKKII